MKVFLSYVCSLLIIAFAIPTLCADDLAIELTGTCSYSGSTQAINVGDTVTITITVNGDVVDTEADPGRSSFENFEMCHFRLRTDKGYEGTTDANNSATLSLSTNLIGGVIHDNYGGLPGISDGEYGALFFIDLNVSSNFPGDTGGAVALEDVLNQGILDTFTGGTITLEPDWDSRVVITISSATLDVSVTAPTLPPALVDSIDYWNDPIYDGWYFSNWFGLFKYFESDGNWVWSQHIGWAYFSPNGTPTSAWLWSNRYESWMWGCSVNGYGYNGWWLYRESDNNWLWIKPGGPTGTLIFDENQNKWL